MIGDHVARLFSLANLEPPAHSTQSVHAQAVVAQSETKTSTKGTSDLRCEVKSGSQRWNFLSKPAFGLTGAVDLLRSPRLVSRAAQAHHLVKKHLDSKHG
jgi:hypothetical protein